MVDINTDRIEANAELERAWSESENRKSKLDDSIKTLIKNIITSPSVTFRYIMITGILAKKINPAVHARALQKGSSLKGSYDARSLCHKVVVPFEHTRGDMWGYSNEPFVSKTARHPEHDKNNPQLRDKTGAAMTHQVLEWANAASDPDLFEALVYIMILGRQKLANTPAIQVGKGGNLQPISWFLEEFLSGSADGGSRLVATIGAFMSVFNPDAQIKVYNTNASDQYSNTAGDIELLIDNMVIAGIECKDREFEENDITDGIKKARESGVSEYVFIAGYHSKKISYDFTNDMKVSGLDLYSIYLPDVLNSWIKAINIQNRAKLPHRIIDNLIKMKRMDVAHVAKEIWTSCSGKSS